MLQTNKPTSMLRKFVSKIQSSLSLLTYESGVFQERYSVIAQAPCHSNDHSTLLQIKSKYGDLRLAKEHTVHSMNELLSFLNFANSNRQDMDKASIKSNLKCLPIDTIFYEELKDQFKIYIVFRTSNIVSARQTLEDYKEKLSIKERLRILLWVAEYIHFLHSRKWVHGALSWDNVFWDTKAGTFYIGDLNRTRSSVSDTKKIMELEFNETIGYCCFWYHDFGSANLYGMFLCKFNL